MFRPFRIPLLLIVFPISTMLGQDLLTVEFVENLSRQALQTRLDLFGIQIAATSGVDSYKITYTTTGSDGRPDTASGLMTLPDVVTGPLPLVCYQHGTTDGRDDVPSNLDGGYELGIIFASVGMVVAAPDFIGMGESRGFHPYVHADTEASAAVDMLYAVLQYLEENSLERDDEFFITGYSQGGHAAMAAHRLIQTSYSEDFNVTAALPMSGPYSISGVMRDLVLQDEEYFSPSFIVYSLLGARAVNPTIFDDVSEIFRPEFLMPIREFEQSGTGRGLLNLQLLTILENQFGASVPKFMFLDSILTAVELEADHPINAYMASNDVYDWVPEVPVRMTYCPDDDQVPFENSIFTDSVMNNNGSIDVMAVDVSGGAPFNHVSCILPSLNYGIPWLLSFLDASVPVIEIAGTEYEIQMYPNPAADRLYIKTGNWKPEAVIIYNINGEKLFFTEEETHELVVQVTHFDPGIYFVQLVDKKDTYTAKVIIGR